MAFSARYFRQEELDGVRADVDLVIKRMAGLDSDAPPPKRAKRAAAAEAAAPDNTAADPIQLAIIPAHLMVLNISDYFKVQQVRMLALDWVHPGTLSFYDSMVCRTHCAVHGLKILQRQRCASCCYQQRGK
jgi:hypothetical protein